MNTYLNKKQKRATIKWVNDVFVGGKKIGGMLCECVNDPSTHTYHLSVGIGVNLNDNPSQATSLSAEINSEVEVDSFVKVLAKNVAEKFKLADIYGFEGPLKEQVEG